MGIADIFPFLKPLQPNTDPGSQPTQTHLDQTHPALSPEIPPHPAPRHTPLHHDGHTAQRTANPDTKPATAAPARYPDVHHSEHHPQAAQGQQQHEDHDHGEVIRINSIPIATPTIEMQPWVYDFIGWLRSSTYGVARVDLKRPTPPDYSQYTGGNIFVVQPSPVRQPGRGWRGRPVRPPGVRAELVGQDSIRVKDLDAPYVASGARLKITRHVSLGPEGEVPWIDCGMGLNFDMELQKLSPVARIKIKDIAAIKAFPHAVLKVGGEWPLFNTSLALKLHYEVPLIHLRQPFRPPARLLLRLDHIVNSGVKLSPSGIEFDETVMQLGQSTSVRAAGGLQFPRQLPIQGELHDAFKLQLHRLGLKTFW